MKKLTVVLSLAALTVAISCSESSQSPTAVRPLFDNVQVVNDVGASVTAITIAAGGSTTISYKIAANSGDGQTGCNASDGTSATVTPNVPAGVTKSLTSLTFSACGDDAEQDVTFSSSTPGTYEITASVIDAGTGTYNTNPAKFTLTVTAPSDATPPVITPNVSGTLGNNGWYTSDVTVTWSVTDAQSAISSSTDCGNTTINTDTGATTLTCSATSAGGTNSQSVTIKRDATAPSNIEFVGGINNDDSYYFLSVPAAPTCTADGAISGLASCNVTGYATTVGTHTLTATATDLAGNKSEVERTYTVLAWTLNGFYQPVDMNGVYNTVKGGSTVPLKFEVFAGATELTATSVVKSFVPTKVVCDSSAPIDDIEFTTTGGTSLRYDTTAGQFVQNWQTPKQAGACYRVTMTTQDNSFLIAFFRLK